ALWFLEAIEKERETNDELDFAAKRRKLARGDDVNGETSSASAAYQPGGSCSNHFTFTSTTTSETTKPTKKSGNKSKKTLV
ncbi:unnamed protein product, partial [Amoebophrya sp. A25]